LECVFGGELCIEKLLMCKKFTSDSTASLRISAAKKKKSNPPMQNMCPNNRLILFVAVLDPYFADNRSSVTCIAAGRRKKPLLLDSSLDGEFISSPLHKERNRLSENGEWRCSTTTTCLQSRTTATEFDVQHQKNGAASNC
jgi:hypothetical protein